MKLKEESAESGPDHRLKVLVVDHQKAIREILTGQLKNDQHSVESAAGGSDALEKIETSNFDLVITRQVMPGMNGRKLAGAIKKISPRTRVLLLTGFEEPKGEEAMNRSGSINHVASKPASLCRLRSAIAKAMA